jgi:transcriptional regulator with XRE-family HTH domain/uncharacterized cupin superfamily protein
MSLRKDVSGPYRTLGIGAIIRCARKQKGWSLPQLASQLQISAATLSNIETGKVVVTLDRLMMMSDILGIPREQLFPSSENRHFEIVRRIGRAQTRVVGIKGAGAIGPLAYHHVVHPLAQGFASRQIEPLHIEVLPVPDEKVSLINHGLEEFFFVLRGEVECLLETPDGLVRPVLGEGDCMYFWSYLPHCIRSTMSKPADTIHVLCSAPAGNTNGQRSDTTTVFSEPSTATLSERVAIRVSSLRQALGMSRIEFAAEIGVGTRRLAEIEGGRKAIPIDFLLVVSKRFRKPVEYFLAGSVVPKPYYFIQRAHEICNVPPRKRRDRRDNPKATAIFRPLARGFSSRSMHPYYVKLPDLEGGSYTHHEHHGQEFVYVLNADVKLLTVLNGKRVTESLSAGDSCFIDSTVPHRFVGARVNPFEPLSAVVIDVFWCPLGEDYLFDAQED